MGSFTITGPDQRKVTINAPDDATPEQIQAKVAQVKQMLLTSAPAAPAAEAAAPAGAQSWADVPGQAWNNIPSSALKTAQTVAYPFMHPQDTVKSLYNIGYGGASKLAGMAGVTQDPAQKATDEATVDNVGSFFKD